jgi:hypothetical protein
MRSIRTLIPVLLSLVTGLTFISQSLFAQTNVPDLLVNYPDLIVHNGQIITVDDEEYNSNPGTIAQAMAVRDGLILSIGNNNEILGLKGPETEVIDLKGKTVLPGFVNNHHHPQGSMEDIAREMFDLPGALVGYYINLVVAPTPDETLAKVAQAVGMLQERAEVKPTDWIGIELFPDGDNFPDLGSVSFMMSAPAEADAPIGTNELSEIIPQNPAVLMSGGGIHISDKDPGVWYYVRQNDTGDPIVEELFTFEF